MADLMNKNVLMDDENEKSGATDGSGAGQYGGFISGGMNTSATTGAGGTGGWTNIQSYLNANKGGTGSEKYLNEKVGSVFNTEKGNLDKSASETKTAAEGQVAGMKDTADNSKKWIDQAASAYDWAGKHGSAYGDNTGKIKTAMTSQYAGPTSFNYSMGQDASRYGNTLADNQGYSNLMRDLYREASGGQISRGGLDLQEQLDVSNESLAKARQDLLGQYAGLRGNIDSTMGDVTSAINNARTSYGQEQNRLRDSVTNYSNDTSTAIANAENSARNSYLKDYQGPALDALGDRVGDSTESFFLRNGRTVEGLQNFLNSPSFSISDLENGTGGAKYLSPADRQAMLAIFPALDSFYGEQRDKYANTADLEKRTWNTIMDILGSEDRKSKGYDAVQRSKNARGV